MEDKEDVCMGGINFGLKPKRTVRPACVIQGYSTDIPSIELLAHNNKSSIDRKYRIIANYSPSPRKRPRMVVMQVISMLSLHRVQNPRSVLRCSPVSCDHNTDLGHVEASRTHREVKND